MQHIVFPFLSSLSLLPTPPSVIFHYNKSWLNLMSARFGDLATLTPVVNLIGICLLQTPDRDSWACVCIIWSVTLYEFPWLYVFGDRAVASFVVTVI